MGTHTNSIKQDVIEKTGLDKEQVVDFRRMELLKLREEGILISIHLTGFGLFETTYDFGEMGVRDDYRRSRMKPGKKVLIPMKINKKIHSIESGFRQDLAKLSHNLIVFMPYYWLSYKGFSIWKEKFDKRQEELEKVKQKIIDNYDVYLKELLADYQVIAQSGFDEQLYKKRGNDRIAFYKNVPYKSRDKFVEAVLEGVKRSMPSKGQIQQIGARFEVSPLYLLSDFEKDQMEVEKLSSQRAIERREKEKQLRLIENEERRQLNLSNMEEREKQLELQKAEMEVRVLEKVKAEKAREQLSTMRSQYEVMLENINNRLAERAHAMLSTMETSGKLHWKVAEQAKGFMEVYQALSLPDMQDKELLQKLEDLSAAVGENKGTSKQVAEVSSILNDIVRVTETVTEDLVMKPSRFQFIR